MSPLVLVSLDWRRPHDPRRSLGTASLAASVRAAGGAVHVLDEAVNDPAFDLDALLDAVEAALADAGPGAWLGVGAFIWNEPEVQALLRRFASTAPIVLGGPQVSFAPAGTLEAHYPGARAFVRGHGEAGLVALLAGRAEPGALGVHLVGAPDAGTRNDTPLDALPSPYLEGVLELSTSVRWETQRGCPYACSFCQHREPGSRLRHRHLGEGRLTAELTRFASPVVQRISVLDPIFHANEDRAIELLRSARDRDVTATFSLQCRAERLTPAFLDALDGLDVHLELGLQTADEAEARAVRRPNQMDRVDTALGWLRDRQLSHEVSLIYGLPGQTLASFERSARWCLDRKVPTIRAWPLMLLRGTPLAAERDRWGFVEDREDGRIPIVVESATMSRADHARMRAIADALPDADRASRTADLGGVA